MVLIQSDIDRKLPHHFDAACAMYGVMDTAEQFRLTSFDEIKSGKLDMMLRINTSCAVGSTEFMREVFTHIGNTEVRLPRNSNRPSEIVTLTQAHQRVAAGEKLFIKPLVSKQYGISGLVLDGAKYTILNDVPGETLFYAYKPFSKKLISEWRIYVHRHRMVDARNYSGDYCAIVNPTYVNHVIQQNKADFPIAYTIDIGIFEDLTSVADFREMENVVIEYNDMWAIGNYGIPNDLYLTLLKDRYFQIKNG
jgi:hypothetical protein